MKRDAERDFGRSSTRWLFAIAIAAVLGSSLAQRYLGHALEDPDLDFHDYYFAAKAVRFDPHTALYEGATEGNPQLRSAPATSPMAQLAKKAGVGDVELYLYPPLLADLLVPMTRLSPDLAARLWRILNLALVLACVAALARMLRVRLLSFEFATFAVLAYGFWPVHEAVSLGQVSIAMLALWTIGVTAYFDGRVGWSALAFALATALKVTPVLVLPVFLIWKDKRWIAWYIGGLALLIAAMGAINGWHNLLAYVQVVHGMGGSVPALQNKNVGSVVAWVYYGKVFTTSSVQGVLASSNRWLTGASEAANLAFYVVCLFLVWRQDAVLTKRNRAMALAMFAFVLAAVSPVSWRHGYAVAIVPLAVLWAEALHEGATWLRGGLLAATTVTIGGLWFDLAARLPLPAAVKIICASAWVVFATALCVEVLYNHVRKNPWHGQLMQKMPISRRQPGQADVR